MWWSRRSLAALAAGAAVSACGFTPVYGPGGSAETLRGRVLAEAPGNRDAFDFVARIEDRLGRADAPDYALGYSIQTDQDGVGVTSGQETTRYNVTGRVDYTVRDAVSGQVLRTGNAKAFTGYSATGSILGTVSAADDASARLMTILADQVVTELVATAPDWAR